MSTTPKMDLAVGITGIVASLALAVLAIITF